MSGEGNLVFRLPCKVVRRRVGGTVSRLCHLVGRRVGGGVGTFRCMCQRLIG